MALNVRLLNIALLVLGGIYLMFEEDWNETKKQFYGEQNRWVDEENGVIDFSPDGMKTVKGGENLSYDDYLEIQHDSLGHQKESLMFIFVNYDMGYYKGEIAKITRKNVLFERLFIDAIRPDGTGYESKGSHVWMPRKPFSKFKLYDCVEFDAEVYRYLKTGHGKMIDYGLCNPTNIKKIQPYQLPSDQQLMAQAVDDILWETSLYHDAVDRINWSDVRNEEEYRSKFNQLFTIMTLNDISWIGIKNLLQIRHGLWCSASNKVPKNLVRRVTDAEWSYFQPGMIFLLSLY